MEADCRCGRGAVAVAVAVRSPSRSPSRQRAVSRGPSPSICDGVFQRTDTLEIQFDRHGYSPTLVFSGDPHGVVPGAGSPPCDYVRFVRRLLCLLCPSPRCVALADCLEVAPRGVGVACVYTWGMGVIQLFLAPSPTPLGPLQKSGCQRGVRTRVRTGVRTVEIERLRLNCFMFFLSRQNDRFFNPNFTPNPAAVWFFSRFSVILGRLGRGVRTRG